MRTLSSRSPIPLATLGAQLNYVALADIEVLLFDTENEVRFDGFGGTWVQVGIVPVWVFVPWAADLELVHTGAGNDHLYNVRQGLEYVTDGGNDIVTLSAVDGSAETTIHGGSHLEGGGDSVWGSIGAESIAISGVEFVDMDGDVGGDDRGRRRCDAIPELVTIWNAESIYGSAGDDWVYADKIGGADLDRHAGGDDTLTVGTNYADTVTAYGGIDDDSSPSPNVQRTVYGDDDNRPPPTVTTYHRPRHRSSTADDHYAGHGRRRQRHDRRGPRTPVTGPRDPRRRP